MNHIEPGYFCADLVEFNALLVDWLGTSPSKTVAGEHAFKKDYIRLPIAGVECGLSGDTTREGVAAYLIALEVDRPFFSVIASQQGLVNRIVIGEDQQPTLGFYLYAREPLAHPTMLANSEWPRGATAGPETGASNADSAERLHLGPNTDRAHSSDLSTVPAADLFALQGSITAELRRREILRTNNPPVGDYAEWLTARALGGLQLATNSMKSYDLNSAEYGRVQVKARVISSPERVGQRQAGVFRSRDFEHAALVLLSDIDFAVVSAVLLPLSAVEERWTWSDHVRGWRLMMNGPTMQHPRAIDITAELQGAAFSAL